MANELVGVPVTQNLINKLISVASEPIDRVWRFKDEMTKFRRTLICIQAVLCDADKKREENQLVKNWLRDLKDVAYDAEDVFDELKYEGVRRKIEIQGGKRKKVKNFFSPSNPLRFRLKMANKMKDINQMLDQIAKDMERFNFVKGNCTTTADNASTSSRETYSVLDDSNVVGRQHDKSMIVDWLTTDNSSIIEEFGSVVRIIGIGGVGKTTLAKLVFKEKLVMDHFDKKVWVSVSQNSNEKEIYSKLLKSIGGAVEYGFSLEDMVNNLKESLVNKRCLIVLDDVWNNENISLDDILKTLLFMAAKGSKVLVTTRSDEVASIMGSIYTHHLVGLSEEECWTIFEQHAFGYGGAEKTPNLIKIGKEIVKKCGGVPIAAKTLGGLMYSKKKEDEWLTIQNSEIWNLPEAQKKILSVLKLSYYHLPTHLQECFSYCSMFPKHYNIKKEKLIQLWMAEGFLGAPRENKLLENIGDEYFNNLLRNSFFQVEERNKWEDIKSYKMHDLVHDLALSVVGTECFVADGSTLEGEEVTELRRIQWVYDDDFVPPIPEALYKARKLRTIILLARWRSGENINKSVWDHMFFKLRYLRVLDLSNIDIKELPPSIGKLKQLRYLDLSNTKLASFPKSFTSLYNLQTLRLKGCYYLKELPSDMRKLINLRHLQFSESRLSEMPREVGKLSQLQNLSEFVVGKSKGFRIEELQGLKHLGGKLKIRNLENVSLEIVRDANIGPNLKEKQNICSLELYWDDYDKHDVTGAAYGVIEGLQPHPNLKRLKICRFVALEFPTWMMNAVVCLPKLVSVSLIDCPRCEHLPALGELPFLKILTLERMEAVKRIGSEFYYSNVQAATNISFPSLIELHLIGLYNLEEWSGNRFLSSSSFPCLETLEISKCSKLTITPTLFPSLKTLNFRSKNTMALMSLVKNNLASLTFIHVAGGCEGLLPQVVLRGNNVLKSLKIDDCRNVESFVSIQNQEEEAQDQVLFNSSLCEIRIRCCVALKSVPNLWGMNSLRVLTITWCESLKSFPDGIHSLPALEELNIGPFSRELKSFPFPDFREGTDEQFFVSLRVLSIHGWSGLESLPDQFQYLNSLQELRIDEFHYLKALPEWLGNLTSLQTLELRGCRRLKYLPSQEQMLRLTALQTLEIGNSLLLEDRCLSKNGEEVNKIANIPNRVTPVRCYHYVIDPYPFIDPHQRMDDDFMNLIRLADEINGSQAEDFKPSTSWEAIHQIFFLFSLILFFLYWRSLSHLIFS